MELFLFKIVFHVCFSDSVYFRVRTISRCSLLPTVTFVFVLFCWLVCFCLCLHPIFERNAPLSLNTGSPRSRYFRACRNLNASSISLSMGNKILSIPNFKK